MASATKEKKSSHHGRKFYSDRPAAFHCRIYYTNGAKRTYWSRDFLANGQRDNEGGFNALVELINEEPQYVKCAQIYDKRNGADRLVRDCMKPTDGWRICEDVVF